MNTPNLTPEQIVWGRFYAELFDLAQRLRGMMQAANQPTPAQPDSTDTETPKRVNRPVDSTPRRRGQAEVTQ